MSESVAMGGVGPQRVDTIPMGIKVSWASGALGVAILMNTVAFFALFYMVSVLKIEPALAGTLMFITKLFDVLTDPVVGGWSDRIKSPGSRRRPFLLVGMIVSPLAFLMIFSTPVFSDQVFTATYIFVAMLLYTLGYTLFNVPYISMPAEMTDNYHERSSIHGVRMIFVSIAGIVVGAGAPALLEVMGRKSWDSYAAIGGIGAVIIFLAMFCAWYGTGKARFTRAEIVPPKLLPEIRYVFADRHYIRLLSIKAAQLLGAASMQSALAFFFVYALQRDFKLLSYYGLVMGIVSVIVSPLIVRFSRVIGKRGAYIAAATSMVLVSASWIFATPGEPTWAVLLRGAVIAFAVSGNVIMAMSMLTDIINHSATFTGVRREGVYTSFYSFVEKATFAFGPLIVGAAMSIAGFDESATESAMNTPALRQSLLLGVSYIPIAMTLLSMYLLWGYRLTQSDLEARRD